MWIVMGYAALERRDDVVGVVMAGACARCDSFCLAFATRSIGERRLGGGERTLEVGASDSNYEKMSTLLRTPRTLAEKERASRLQHASVFRRWGGELLRRKARPFEI